MFRPLALALLLSAALSVHAAAPTTESIETLLAVTKTERLLESVQRQFDPLMRQAMAQGAANQNLSAEQRRRLDALPAELATIFQEEMSWPRLKPLYTKIYQDAFTQEEIDGLIAFYRSPAGMAYVDKMPLVTQKSMELMQSLMPPVMKRVQAAMAKAVGDGK
jgi:hypothetical protein